MSIDWRTTLKSLLPAFESLASKHLGLNHLLIERSDHTNEGEQEPSWFSEFSLFSESNKRNRNSQWSVQRLELFSVSTPGYRAPLVGELFEEQSEDVICDQSGVVRAVLVHGRQATGYLCGRSGVAIDQFMSLANAASAALTDAEHLDEHHFASDLVDLFHSPRYAVRYLFGDVPNQPSHYISNGWSAGALQFRDGVLVDVPVGESNPTSQQWLLLLHRLAWRQYSGTGLRAKRMCWGGGTEIPFDIIHQESPRQDSWADSLLSRVSPHRYYSVLGTKECPLDVSLASAFAIHILLAELNSHSHAQPNAFQSKQTTRKNTLWYERPIPLIKSIEDFASLKEQYAGTIGILVATDIEKSSVLQRMHSLEGQDAILQCFDKKNTYYLGRIGMKRVVVCMSSMGSGGRDASMLVTTEMIQAWNVSAVIMIGIAFGKDAEKQEIGRVLVSDQIIPYEPQRVGESSNQNRGVPQQAGAVLLNRFRNVDRWIFQSPDKEKCRFQVGPLLSGEKLVDDSTFKQELFHRYPTAIGGEMEGAGLASAASRQGKEWIVVKAICDWADGAKSKDHQGFAAAAAVSLVEHVLSQPGCLDALNVVPKLQLGNA